MEDESLKDFSVITQQLNPEQIIKNPLLLRIYANSFLVARTPNDIFFIAMSNGVPQSITNMTFITAKKLAAVLAQQIQIVEEAIGELKDVPKK